MDIKLKRIDFIPDENGVKFKLRLQNKHKSRTIQDLTLSKTENMILNSIPNLSNGAILEVDFMVPSNDISTAEFVSPKLSGVLSYKVRFTQNNHFYQSNFSGGIKIKRYEIKENKNFQKYFIF